MRGIKNSCRLRPSYSIAEYMDLSDSRYCTGRLRGGIFIRYLDRQGPAQSKESGLGLGGCALRCVLCLLWVMDSNYPKAFNLALHVR